MVGEICKFSIVLFEDQYIKDGHGDADDFYKVYIKVHGPDEKNVYENINFNLLIQLLNTLSDLCVGPNYGNQ